MILLRANKGINNHKNCIAKRKNNKNSTIYTKYTII